ncbi:hypothetical protein ACFSC6_17495 [Rufibacter sediminis]|uniref:TraB/GumN family protein n=1 Tax=Rufibacter sediminis TaxID=2762756 RepID=A0ABR6VQA7_9BACT|nr:hypothetical protein [Rufibacter sediminis]MBC3539335.1 hypothetical protein [Rufibacter sediminis]
MFNLLIATISYGQTKVWLIGTAHEENKYINPDSLLNIFHTIKPDLILLELEDEHFTKDFQYNVEKYPLKYFLTTNENIASYKYQQQNGIQLRPFDLNGRHDFYKKENYLEQENKLFREMLDLYKKDKFSDVCKADFEILLTVLQSNSELNFHSLREANTAAATKFLALKNKVSFDLMLSIVLRTNELKNWLRFAKLRKDYWDVRNKAMAENILRYVNEFKGKEIIVLVGNDHKYALLDLLKQNNLEVKNFYD